MGVRSTFVVISLLVGLAAAVPAGAQINRVNVAREVHWDQKLDAQAPLDATFRDETGATVPLSTFFGKRPVVLMMPFYRCPGICTLELDVMTKTFQDPAFRFRPGKEYETVVVSINPKEDASVAAAKKAEYLQLYGHPETAAGWHFLTGTADQIARLAQAVGYHFVYDAHSDQYAHPAGLVVLTPKGHVSKYFLFRGGVFPPRDLHLALVEASDNRIGSPVDQFLLLCCNYDPATGRYGVAIKKILQLAGGVTVLCLGTFIFMSVRKEKRATT